MITPQIEKALLRAEAYLGGRQCHNGGFCFYRNDYLEEPNLHDTYHALAGYSLLERPIPNREKIISYLAHQRSRSHQPAYLYYYTFSVRLLESVPDEGTMADIEGLRLATPDNRTEFSNWLVTALKVVGPEKNSLVFQARCENCRLHSGISARRRRLWHQAKP